MVRKIEGTIRGRLLDWGIRFFMAAALAGVRTPGGHAPFALGCVAAAGPGADGTAALLGAAAGALAFMGFQEALPFLAVATLILAAAAASRGSAVLSSSLAVSLSASALFLAVEAVYVMGSLSPQEEIVPCLAAAALTGISAWAARPLLVTEEGRDPAEGVLYLSAALLLALREVTVSGLSLCRTLLCPLLAWTAVRYGAAAGAAAGLVVGLTVDLCGGGSGSLTAGLGLGGLLCGQFHGGRRWRAVLLFLAGALAAVIGGGGPLAGPFLVECGAGMLLFLCLPPGREDGKRVRRGTAPGEILTEGPGVGEMRARLEQVASALRELYEECGAGEGLSEENPAVIFDRAAEQVCRGCARCDLCWQKEYPSTFRALDGAVSRLLDRGRAVPEDFPSYFTGRCAHLTELLRAIDGEVSAFLLRRRYRRQLEETRRSARGQYAQLSELLSAAVSAVPRRPVADEAVPVSGGEGCQLGTAQRPRRGEAVCGDTVSSFRTPDGSWCLLLADGMGSGEGARKESALVCRLLRQFLEAGIGPEAALKTLDTAMALRGEETGSFATMDLCTFDGRSGEASFYKYGAAPSYLKREGTVRRIVGSSLPVGLRGSGPDVTKVRMDPGSFAVMVSDGVADPGQDGWLQELLAGWSGGGPQELAGEILSESVRRTGLADDCGVQILYWPRTAEAV